MKKLLIFITSAFLVFLLFVPFENSFAQESESEIKFAGTAIVGGICSGMREEPNMGSDVLLQLERSSRVMLHDFYDHPFLKVTVDSITGYASTSCFRANDTIAELKYRDDRRLLSMVKEFGERTALRIDKGEIWVGMTERMLIRSMGQPNSKNITETRYGRSEQWIYRRGNYRADYVYVRNGEVESIQRSE